MQNADHMLHNYISCNNKSISPEGGGGLLIVPLRAMHLLFRAWAVIKYVLRAASTWKNIDDEQQALSSRIHDLFIEKKRFSPSNLADILPFWEELLRASVSIECQQNEDPVITCASPPIFSVLPHSNLNKIPTSSKNVASMSKRALV